MPRVTETELRAGFKKLFLQDKRYERIYDLMGEDILVDDYHRLKKKDEEALRANRSHVWSLFIEIFFRLDPALEFTVVNFFELILRQIDQFAFSITREVLLVIFNKYFIPLYQVKE